MDDSDDADDDLYASLRKRLEELETTAPDAEQTFDMYVCSITVFYY